MISRNILKKSTTNRFKKTKILRKTKARRSAFSGIEATANILQNNVLLFMRKSLNANFKKGVTDMIANSSIAKKRESFLSYKETHITSDQILAQQTIEMTIFYGK